MSQNKSHFKKLNFAKMKKAKIDAHEIVLQEVGKENFRSLVKIKGYDYSADFNFDDYLSTLVSTGFQSSKLGEAIKIINSMLDAKLEQGDKMKIFLAFTSGVGGSSGTREAITYLCKHRMVDVITATGGAVEEDIMKTLSPHYVQPDDSKYTKDHKLRERGINRIYNILVPNSNYVKFESFMNPIIEGMVAKQVSEGFNWTASKMIKELGTKITNEESWVRQAYLNDIPVYAPALLDGSIGDMIYFSQNTDRVLKLDAIEDLCAINTTPILADTTGVIVLGGGLVKHHTLNANLMRNGCEYCVIVNMGIESDGSDASASDKEAITWGKVSQIGSSVKVFAEVSLVLPSLIAGCFKKREKEFDEMLKRGDR